MKIVAPSTIAAEARETLKRVKETPEQYFARLIKHGFINAKGEVTTVIGGDASPEPESRGGPSNRTIKVGEVISVDTFGRTVNLSPVISTTQR